MQLDYNGKTIEECNELFNSALLDVCSKTVPQTKPMFQGKRRHLPWWNDECTSAVKAKRRAYKLWRRHKTQQLKNEYKTLRSKCKETLDQAQKTKFQALISNLNHQTCSKELWGLISKFNGKLFKPVEVLKSNNTRHQENIDNTSPTQASFVAQLVPQSTPDQDTTNTHSPGLTARNLTTTFAEMAHAGYGDRPGLL